jgi:hypothetical protein
LTAKLLSDDKSKRRYGESRRQSTNDSKKSSADESRKRPSVEARNIEGYGRKRRVVKRPTNGDASKRVPTVNCATGIM